MIRQWKPWEKSTGPKTPEGKSIVSRNAWKGGEWLQLRLLARALRRQQKYIEGISHKDNGA